MSQLGRCKCGSMFIKANVASKNSLVALEIDVCPVCDVEKMEKTMKPIEKSVPRDRFGLEKLEK